MKTNTLAAQDGVPQSFLTKFGQHVTAILCGFDRLRFRATQRLLFQPNSMEAYLATCKVLIKNFKSFAEGITQRVKAAAYQAAAKAQRPVRYLGGDGSGWPGRWIGQASAMCSEITVLPGWNTRPKRKLC